MNGRYTERRNFGPSLDWHDRPAIGNADRQRHMRRIREIRLFAAALLVFWAGVVFAIVWFH